jgi:hypothetical protein
MSSITIIVYDEGGDEYIKYSNYSPKTWYDYRALTEDFGYTETFNKTTNMWDLTFNITNLAFPDIDSIKISFTIGNNGENYAYLPNTNGHLATEEWVTELLQQNIPQQIELYINKILGGSY